MVSAAVLMAEASPSVMVSPVLESALRSLLP
jgi:hypothetical protein